MARTPSNMSPLGSVAPDFSLPDVVSGEVRTRDSFAPKKGFLVMFICNHCPFVKHIEAKLTQIGKEYQKMGIAVAAISSNDVANYPDDSPEKMKEKAAELGFTFPYLYDESQEVARAYDAACTPDFFLYDASFKLVYRGQLDDSRPGSETPVTGSDLCAAMDALVEGQPVREKQVPSLGCNIKWKAA